MIKVTLDTNVLVSGSFWTGDSFRIMEKIDKKELISVSSSEIIKEYNEVLTSDEIMEKVEAKSLLLSEVTKKVIANSLLIEPQETITLVTEDPDDNKILACAKAGKVDYIISQDAHLLKLNVFESIPILTPEEFLRKFM